MPSEALISPDPPSQLILKILKILEEDVSFSFVYYLSYIGYLVAPQGEGTAGIFSQG